MIIIAIIIAKKRNVKATYIALILLLLRLQGKLYQQSNILNHEHAIDLVYGTFLIFAMISFNMTLLTMIIK